MAGIARRGGKKNRKHSRNKRNGKDTRQKMRTLKNKEAKTKRRVKWLAKRKSRAVVTSGRSKGLSVFNNEALLKYVVDHGVPVREAKKRMRSPREGHS